MLYVITVDVGTSSLELCIWSMPSMHFKKKRWLGKTIRNLFYQNEIMNTSTVTTFFFPSSNLFSFVRTKVLICYYLKLDIKYKYNWNQMNITSLLISYIFSFFTGNDYSLQGARLILFKLGPQLLSTNWWRIMWGNKAV